MGARFQTDFDFWIVKRSDRLRDTYVYRAYTIFFQLRNSLTDFMDEITRQPRSLRYDIIIVQFRFVCAEFQRG